MSVRRGFYRFLLENNSDHYFFFRIVFEMGESVWHEVLKYEVTGAMPHPAFDLFYFNTSMMWILVFIAVCLILLLIASGSFIGTGKRTLPIGTPLFVLPPPPATV